MIEEKTTENDEVVINYGVDEKNQNIRVLVCEKSTQTPFKDVPLLTKGDL